MLSRLISARGGLLAKGGGLRSSGGGLLKVLNSSGPTLLANLDFSAPVVQSFPETAAGLASALGDAAATPSYIWNCQETSGNLVDLITGEELTASSTPLQGRVAVGINDGSGYLGRKAIENDASVDSFDADTAGVMDATGSVAWLFVFRMVDKGSNSYLVQKRGGAEGYYVRVNTGNGYLFGVVQDDATNQQTQAVTENHADGAWHYCLFGWDATAEESFIESDLGGFVDTAPALGSVSSSLVLSLLDQGTGMQITYVAAFEGSAAEAARDATGASFWTHASDPTGLLTTQTRASAISVPVADGYVGHFAADTLPIGYHSAFTGSSKLGLYCNSAVINILPYSEILSSGWGISNCSRADSQADSPDGFKSAASITATNINGFAYEDVASIPATTKYTFSVWVRRNGGSDVDGEIRLYDITGTATLATTTFTAADAWQLVSVTGTTGASGTTLRSIIQVDANAESIFVWGMQTNLGDSRGAYIRTNGASASLAASDYRVEELVPMAAARVEADFVSALFSNNAGNHSVFTATAGSTNGWRLFYVDSADFLMQARDEDGNIWSSGAAGSPAIDTPYNYVARWDIDSGDFPEDPDMTLSFHVDGTKIGVPEQDQTTVTDALAYLYVGHSPSTGTELDGYIQSIRVYNEVGEEPTV